MPPLSVKIVAKKQVLLVKVLQRLPSACRVGYIGKGGLARGSETFSAFPMPISLVTFLFGDKKVTPPLLRNGISQRP